MDDRYADDEYRSSYPGQYAEGQYAAGDHPSGAYPPPVAAGADYPSGEYVYDQGYPDDYQQGYEESYYDDLPPAPEPEPARPRIEPLDEHGVRAVEIATLLWLVAFVGLLPFWGPLASHGLTWWIWTCLAGFGLGAIGIEITRRRRARAR